jgi:hypothetical protein
MYRLINLTPHTVVLAGLEIPPSGIVARVEEHVTRVGTLAIGEHEIPLVAKRFGEIINLPEREDGVLYVTSALVAQAAWAIGRTDVVHPGDLVRDAEGRVIGAASLCVAP